MSEERIAKYIAKCGVCSRRDAEKLIESGRVKVNKITLTTPAFKVSDSDVVEVDGQIIKATGVIRLWAFYKPKGVITSNQDPQGRQIVFELLPEDMPRVVTIGRLDYNTEGLLLLTNSGELARKMELPSSELVREYRVRIDGVIAERVIQALARGVMVEGIKYKGIEVEKGPARDKGVNTWITMRLKEGKNREIRKVLEHFGYQVSRLIRTKYGSFELGDMKPGEVRELKL